MDSHWHHPSVKVGVIRRDIQARRRELAEVDVGARMASTGGFKSQSISGKGDDAEMLGDYPIDVVLLATDLDAARDFYRDKIGLELLNENSNAVTFKCGSNHLAISKSTVGTADPQTQAAWRVKDLDAELDALRGRGVRIEDYDIPGLKTVDGIADIGFARMAWFIDPAKNCLGVMQLK